MPEITGIEFSPGFHRAFPGLADRLEAAMEMLRGVETFDDVERLFLEGTGLSPGTYRSYLTAVRRLYEFSDGRNPLQIRLAQSVCADGIPRPNAHQHCVHPHSPDLRITAPKDVLCCLQEP